MLTGTDSGVFHWLPERGLWNDIPWSSWSDFRRGKPNALSGVTGGIHHFIISVDFENGELANLIPHKYLVDPNGKIGADNFGGLTREERADYDRLMVAREEKPGDRDRLDAIRDKMAPTIEMPAASYDALVRHLKELPKAGTAAAEFLQKLRYSK